MHQSSHRPLARAILRRSRHVKVPRQTRRHDQELILLGGIVEREVVRGELGRVVHADKIHFRDREVRFFGVWHVARRVGGIGRGCGGLPDGVAARDAGVGDDDVEGFCRGGGEGVLEEGELGGPGCYVCLSVGAVVSV